MTIHTPRFGNYTSHLLNIVSNIVHKMFEVGMEAMLKLDT